ncbi:MAG: type II secretion system F family protein [Bacteroidota bacterium]
MPEFRIEGMTLAGRAVSGVIEAENARVARRKAEQIARDRRIKVTGVRSRSTFRYKVQRGNEEPVTGEQKAFTKEEVAEALTKMGYRVIRVERKLFDLKLKPPSREIVTFVRVSADLIRQKLPFNEVMQLLISDTQNKTLRETLKDILADLRQGKDSEQAFLAHEDVLGKFTAHMLGLASKSGSMADIYEATAKFLERQAEFKKNLRSALIMPVATLIALFGACVWYVIDLFPATARLFTKFGVELPPMTAFTLKMSDFLSEHILFILFITVVPLLLFLRFITTEKGAYYRDKYIIRLPVLGPLIHKQNIEIFSRVFHALYTGAGENIDVIRLAAEACGNKYMEHQIKTVAIPMMIERGTGVVEAFEATGVFTKTALARYHSGAESGTIKYTAQQIADFYERETVYKMKNAIDFIQLGISMIIMIVLTLLTLVSSETALLHPKMPGVSMVVTEVMKWFG